jgi:predicted DNA-binding transcriptional regulator AlpA
MPHSPFPRLPEHANNDKRHERRRRSTTSNARGAEEYLTIPEVVAELRIPRLTFYYWRQLGRGPKALKLPNGDVRIRHGDLDSWLSDLEECVR